MPPHTPEIQYFGRNYEKGWDWYKEHFEICSDNDCVGEKSATYMLSDVAARRIRDDLPDVKLIFILRDPVDRAYSDYWLAVREGQEKLSFNEAIHEKEERYLRRGVYVDQLKHFEIFSNEKKKILISEEFWRSPQSMIVEVLQFLGVDSDIIFENIEPKKGGAPRSKILMKLSKVPLLKVPHRMYLKSDYPEMDNKVRNYLVKYFKDKNRELAEYLGKDLSQWEGK